MWDSDTCLRFDRERARPYFDLLAHVHAVDPSFIADLGCGSGNLTELLAQRWPKARVLGVDSSPAMIDTARARHAPSSDQLAFVLGDVRNWRPDRPVDVLICNSVLQWVPDHASLLTDWVARLAPLAGVELSHQEADPAVYLDLLIRTGCTVNAWEATYLHVLHGPDPVVEWYKGTGLRPVLAALSPAHR